MEAHVNQTILTEMPAVLESVGLTKEAAELRRLDPITEDSVREALLILMGVQETLNRVLRDLKKNLRKNLRKATQEEIQTMARQDMAIGDARMRLLSAKRMLKLALDGLPALN
jgi:hypothetical protein